MATLQLGSFDSGKKPANLTDFFKPYHTDGILRSTNKFRSDDNNKFVQWQIGKDVHVLQELLHNAGFMTKKYNEGIFDYVTEAAVRLFQEYMETIELKPCKSDGIVGPATWGYIRAWPAGKKCEWHASRASESLTHKEYEDWMQLLYDAKIYYSNPEKQGPTMRAVNQTNDTGSTLKVEKWNVDKENIHLIGIRRNESKSATVRKNDDLFILLINGMVFKFWGSTDPKVKKVENPKKDTDFAPFLVEGQHKYRFGWHNLRAVAANKKSKRGEYVTYRALRPANDAQNVLVVRDRKNDHILTSEDLIKHGGKPELASFINIHWTGTSRYLSTWSAGCQVIKGQSYMNNRNKPVDCSKVTAATYNDLFQNKNLHKGAYRFLTDLVVCYSKPNVNTMYYTLGNEKEEFVKIENIFSESYVSNALREMKDAVGTKM